MRSFVVVVDAQHDLIQSDGTWPAAGAAALTAPLRAWLANLRAETTAGVLFTFDTHDERSTEVTRRSERFPSHRAKDTPGRQLVVDLGEIHHSVPLYRMEKHMVDMWGESCGPVEALGDFGCTMSRFGRTLSRERFFAELRDAGLSDVTLAGVAAEYRVRLAAAGLVARGFRIAVRTELMLGNSHESCAKHCRDSTEV